jgi:indolepyruvate ferredoxin oxidoreductase beta subunit
MRRQIVCVGTGGQGVILLVRVLCEGARKEGLPVLSAETHGMAMRGGSVICEVKIGGFASPLVLPGRADAMLALDAGEAERNRYYLGPSGAAIVNTPTPSVPGEVDALTLAREAGSPQALNMVLLGFAAGQDAVGVSGDSLRRAVHDLSPERHRDTNLRAFDLGRAARRD